MTDFRARYFRDAERNIREANDEGYGRLRSWYLLLCAIANATMAAVPDNVLVSVIKEQELQGKVSRAIRKDLSGK